MGTLKTRSLEEIEKKMEGMDEDSMRYRVLNSAKNFKTSWVELGQSLYSVWKDKLYRPWGFLKFDAYASKEIGIRKETALKLLKSYYFLEKEEPRLLDRGYSDTRDPASLPTYEAVNVLRLANDKKALDGPDYFRLKKDVLEKGRDAREIKKDLTALMRQREELEPEEAREKKRIATLRRLLTNLKTIKKEIEMTRMLPSSVVKETASLIARIESEIE
ncbi:MAG: hypothetical protein WC515_02755 [Candidatus Omnitrophota bacterium]